MRCVIELDGDIAAARSQQGRVELLYMVRSHENNVAFLRSNAIKGVEEAREGHLPTSLLLGNLLSLHKDAVDVFQKDD